MGRQRRRHGVRMCTPQLHTWCGRRKRTYSRSSSKLQQKRVAGCGKTGGPRQGSKQGRLLPCSSTLWQKHGAQGRGQGRSSSTPPAAPAVLAVRHEVHAAGALGAHGKQLLLHLKQPAGGHKAHHLRRWVGVGRHWWCSAEEGRDGRHRTPPASPLATAQRWQFSLNQAAAPAPRPTPDGMLPCFESWGGKRATSRCRHMGGGSRWRPHGRSCQAAWCQP